MVRITKHPDVRREELLDTAIALAQEHGFEAMSIEQVTRNAGVAKGTFYHYFASKSDLQEQLVGRFGESLFDHLSAADAEPDGSGAARLERLMAAAGSYKLAQPGIGLASYLYREENFALRHRLFDAWRVRARAVLLPVIQAGLDDGSLSFPDAESATDLVLLLWFEAADRLWQRAAACTDADAFAQVMLAGGAAITTAQERLLGLPAGSYSIGVAEELRPTLVSLYSALGSDQP